MKQKQNEKRNKLEMVYQEVMLSYVIWDIIPDLCTDVGKTFL